MDIKKSGKANLDDHRATGFLLGLILALSLLFAAFEYTTRPQSAEEDDSMFDDLAEDLTMKSAPQDTRDMVSAVSACFKGDYPKRQGGAAHGQCREDSASDEQTRDRGGASCAEKRQRDGGAAASDRRRQGHHGAAHGGADTGVPGRNSAIHEMAHAQPALSPQAQRQKIQGKVVVSFIVNKDGSISSPKVVKSVDPLLDNEAMRVIKMMPRWKPGMDKGATCRTMFAIPVNFVL